jgi:hypothetical protein
MSVLLDDLLRVLIFEKAGPYQETVLIEPVEFEHREPYLADAMFTIFLSLFDSIRQCLRNRACFTRTAPYFSAPGLSVENTLTSKPSMGSAIAQEEHCEH